MSGSGQKHRFDRQPLTSGVPQSTDILRVRPHVSNVPITDIRPGGHPVKMPLALPSDPSYSMLLVGLPAMVQERPFGVGRRLSAILAADVAGYSRLMHHDEEATHAKLTALLANGVDASIAEHGGRIVKNTGDGFLPSSRNSSSALS